MSPSGRGLVMSTYMHRFTGLLQFSVARKSSSSQLMILLGHAFPKVSKESLFIKIGEMSHFLVPPHLNKNNSNE